MLLLRCFEHRHLGWAFLYIVALIKRDTPRNIHIEQMLLPMHSLDLALLVKAETRVVYTSVVLDQFWDRPSNDVRARLLSQT